MVDIWSSRLLLIYSDYDMLESTNSEVDKVIENARRIRLEHATQNRDTYVKSLDGFAYGDTYEAILNCACPLTLKFIHELIEELDYSAKRLDSLTESIRSLVY